MQHTEESIMAALNFSDEQWDTLHETGRQRIAALFEDRAVMLEALRLASDALRSVATHGAEFSDVEDDSTMLTRVEEKANAAIATLESILAHIDGESGTCPPRIAAP